jgi:hypothetical protein
MSPSEKGKAKRAAPVAKSEAVLDRILEAVGSGTPLAEVLREDWAPHHSSFYGWLNDDPDLDRRFAAAREAGHDNIAANTRRVARGEAGSSKDVKRDRLIVDTDLKLLQAWDRRYRPTQILAGDPDAPLIPAPTDPTDPTIAIAAIAAILEAARARMEAQERWLAEHGAEQKQIEYRDGSDLA